MPFRQNFDYKLFFNQLPEAGWIVDAESGALLDANHSAERIYGYSKEEFRKLKISDIDPNENPTDVQKRMQKIKEAGYAKFETRHRTKNGKILDVRVSVNLMLVDNHPYITAICQDITEVNERKEQFRAIFDNIEEGLTIEELDSGKFITCNPYATKMFGYSKEEFQKLGVEDIVPTENHSDLHKQKPKYKKGEVSLMRERPLLRKDGSTFFADVDISKVYSIGGKEYIAALVRDVTQIRKTRMDLEISQKKFQTLFNQLPEAAWVVDAITTRLIDCNLANEQQYGYSKEEFLKLRIPDIDLHDDPTVVEERTKKIREEGKAMFETQHRTKDGRVLDVLVSIQLIFVDGGPIFISTSHDITKMKQHEKELQELNEQLEQRVVEEIKKYAKQQNLLIQQSKLAAKGELIRNIAHQWRQPLNAAAASIQSLKMFAELDQISPQEIDTSVSQAMQQIQHLSAIIDRFSSYFAPEEARTIFSVNEVIHETLDLLGLRFKDNQITVSTQGEPLTKKGFVTDFKQVLLVLFNNAMEAIQQRRKEIPALRGEIIVTLDVKNGQDIIRIQDNGNGISKEIEEKVFDPYFTTKFQGQDVGISLYMSKMIIERNFGGLLRLEESRKGKTVFSIELPHDA